MKKTIQVALAIMLCLSMISCAASATPEQTGEVLPTIDELVIGENTDITANIKFVTFRTDIMDKLNSYAEQFRQIYPNVTITYEGIDDYEATTIIHLTSGIDWGDIMMIPLGIEKFTAPDYFLPLGTAEKLSTIYNYTNAWTHEGNVYGLAYTGNANGLLYNKRVFEEAGITEIPKTPTEFLHALQAIKDNTDAIPLYTNYADEWPMSCWDAYIGINATGSASYYYQTLVHAKDPFSDHGDETHPYAVYKILYDAVAMGLTEADYTTTDESMCYSMINNGEIGCLTFASWAVVQAMSAGPNADDIGYMPFPITVDGKQYVSINGDYSYGVNKNSSRDDQIASMLYIKWLIHEAGFDFSEGGLAVLKGGENPSFYDSLNECVLMENDPAIAGEENFFDQLNMETGLLFNANGNAKGQNIVESAFNGTKTFDEIMAEWNTAWANAQEKFGITVEP
jgi:ABC-type glycerol-3-phosphate transport system substrate-binding protein